MKSRSNSSGFVVTLERLRHLHAELLSGTTTRGADFELRAWLIRVLNIDVNLDWGIQPAPLIQATNEERFDRVHFLCALGADAKVTQLRGCTCLHSAAFSGRVDMGRSPAHLAACDDNVHSLGMLVQANTAINDAVDPSLWQLHATLGGSLNW